MNVDRGRYLMLTLALVALTPACASSKSGSTDAGPTDAGMTTPTDAGMTTPTDAGMTTPSCDLTSNCSAADKTCVGIVSNAGQTTFGLRMTEIDFSSPASFMSGVFAQVLSGAVGLDEPGCNQDGTATFSWLLQFDTQAQTLTTGGAKPVSDPTMGYSFDNETISALQVQPVTYSNVTVGSAGQFSTTGMDLVMPVFLSASGSSAVVLPLNQVQITMGTLSSNNDCIGSYNAAGLQPSNSCNPDATATPPVPGFIDGAALSAYITLEAADNVIIPALNGSLCTVLAGSNATDVTTNSMGVSVCARNSNGEIIYQGNWCSTTNSAATNSCADSVEVQADFAASSVTILN